MENRIDRKGDASLYQPKIHSERIKFLYALKQETGKPMTVLLDEAIRGLAERYAATPRLEEPAFEKVEPETWEEIREYRKLLRWLPFVRDCFHILCIWSANRGSLVRLLRCTRSASRRPG